MQAVPEDIGGSLIVPGAVKTHLQGGEAPPCGAEGIGRARRNRRHLPADGVRPLPRVLQGGGDGERADGGDPAAGDGHAQSLVVRVLRLFIQHDHAIGVQARHHRAARHHAREYRSRVVLQRQHQPHIVDLHRLAAPDAGNSDGGDILGDAVGGNGRLRKADRQFRRVGVKDRRLMGRFLVEDIVARQYRMDLDLLRALGEHDRRGHAVLIRIHHEAGVVSVIGHLIVIEEIGIGVLLVEAELDLLLQRFGIVVHHFRRHHHRVAPVRLLAGKGVPCHERQVVAVETRRLRADEHEVGIGIAVDLVVVAHHEDGDHRAQRRRIGNDAGAGDAGGIRVAGDLLAVARRARPCGAGIDVEGKIDAQAVERAAGGRRRHPCRGDNGCRQLLAVFRYIAVIHRHGHSGIEAHIDGIIVIIRHNEISSSKY